MSLGLETLILAVATRRLYPMRLDEQVGAATRN
jgi:hypothetical protein